jgi:hypothetical protein
LADASDAMTVSGENLLVLAIVAVAVIYLARRTWGVLAGKRRGGCGTCASCPSERSDAGPQVISVESLLQSSDQ